jgi:hypothetical protein
MKFYVVQSMTCVHRIKLIGLHYDIIYLDKFTIQMIHIYRDVRRIQKYIKEYQFNLDLIIIKLQPNHTISSYILLSYSISII